MRKNLPLVASIGLNLILLVGIWALLDRPPAPQEMAGKLDAMPVEIPVQIPEKSVPPSPPAASRFHWSQIEAQDYPTYIANLRSIGCPEETIRDIVAADVHANLAPKRQSLEAQGPASGVSSAVVAQALQGVKEEESVAVRQLLGSAGAVEGEQESRTVVGRGSTHPASVFHGEIDPATLPGAKPVERLGDESAPFPLALNDPELGTNLDATQAKALENLRQRFVESVGGENQNPADPEYRRRWRLAQPANDDLFRLMYGDDAVASIKLRQAQAEEAARQASQRR